jgi:hypothetical protein
MHLDKPPPSLQQLLTAITLYEFVAGFIIICKSTWFWRSLKGGNSIFFYVKGFQIINLYSWGSLETLMQNSPFNPTIRYPWTSPHQVGGEACKWGQFPPLLWMESNPAHCQDPCFMKKWNDENDASLWHTSPTRSMIFVTFYEFFEYL